MQQKIRRRLFLSQAIFILLIGNYGMKKSLVIIFTVLCFIALVSSCKKKSEVACRVASLLTLTTTDSLTETFQYSNDGKLVLYANKFQRKEFSYSGNMLTIITYDAANVVTETSTVQLNTDGNAEHQYVLSSVGDKDTTDYEYDSNGYLTKVIQHGMTTGYVLFFLNVDCNRITAVRTTGSNAYYYSFDYYIGKTNKAGFDVLMPVSFPFVGKAPANLVRHLELAGIIPQTLDYVYEFDENGYVTKATNVSYTGDVTVQYYTYTCN